MMGLDTNILARYYIDDASDGESEKQRIIAKNIIESGRDLMVCKTVLLELEGVMRGYYCFKRQEVLGVFRHLLSLSHLNIEDRDLVERAISSLDEGLDFADALHHASYHKCESILSFDDKKFAQRLNRLFLIPRVIVPN